MLNAFSDLLCSKLCWHNQLVQIPNHRIINDHIEKFLERLSEGEVCSCELYQTIWSKPKPNMLKTLPIIPSSTSQKFTHYSYFIIVSLPIIPILFLFYSFCFIVLCIDI